MIIGDQDADRLHTLILAAGLKKGKSVSENIHEKIRKLLITGDNRLKQGVDPAKVRQSFLQALELAREAGLEDEVRPLVEIRLADLERLAREAPRSAEPDA
jgi:hypothetical protein